MPDSSVQWQGEIRVFYGKFQTFFNSSICCSGYASTCRKFCFTKLLTLILISFFSGILLSYHKKISDNVLMIKSFIRSVPYLLITWNLLEYIWLVSWVIVLSDDMETNAGPKHSFSSQGYKICHWNLNSLPSNMYKKVSVHKFDIICLSETYLNSETSSDDCNVELPGYNIIRDDQPSNTKRGELCVYYKNTLPFKLITINYLQKCISFDIRIGEKCCKCFYLYGSPSRTNDEFESFLKNFELTLDKGHEENDAVTSNYGLHQLIQELTHS